MAALASERRTYTALDFLELAADLELTGSQEWHEIIGGELVAHASPTVTTYERRDGRLVASEALRPGDTLHCPYSRSSA